MEDLIKALETRAKVFSANKFEKFIKIPGKLFSSWAIERFGTEIREKTVTTFWGEPFTVILPETVSTSIYRYGFYERELTLAFLTLIKSGMTFFDIGTHFGYFSCLASHLVGPTGSVHSFEPTRSTFETLRKNTSRLANVKINNVAVYSSSAVIKFTDFGVRYSAYNSVAAPRLEQSTAQHLKPDIYDVQAVTLDDYIQRTGARPDVIKIDAENAELDILKGMENTLRDIRPTISMETGESVEGTAVTSADVVQYIIGKGYSPYEWVKDSLRVHTPKSEYGFDNLIFKPK